MDVFHQKNIFEEVLNDQLPKVHIIADKKIPAKARIRLAEIGEIHALQTDKITYSAVSGHPDIFICKVNNAVIIAPNTGSKIRQKLDDINISIFEGKNSIGTNYPLSAHYNAVITEKYLIHNLKYTDPSIIEACNHHKQIDVKQAYTRCSTIALANDRFITSDKGIQKALVKNGLEVLFVKPDGILLPGFDNGFIGGTCGIYGSTIFFIGNLDHFQEGEKVKQFLTGYKIIELYDGPLFDGGSLIFI